MYVCMLYYVYMIFPLSFISYALAIAMLYAFIYGGINEFINVCTYVCMYLCTVYFITHWMMDEMIRRTNGLAWCRRTLLPKLRSLSSLQSSLPLSNLSPYSSSPSARDDPSRSYSTTRSPGRTLRRERCRWIDHLPAPLHQCTVFGACKTEN